MTTTIPIPDNCTLFDEKVAITDPATGSCVSVATSGGQDTLVVTLEGAQVVEGGQTKGVTTNPTQEELLEQILVELRKTNLQLAIINDIILEDEDTDDTI